MSAYFGLCLLFCKTMPQEPIFKDLNVLELASVLAGPSVGQFFAELGAEVIKVENLAGGGDVTRTWKTPSEPPGDLSAYFCCCNWGKKSIALNLGTPNDLELLKKLVQRSDVVIASYKPGDAEKLGVSYQQLRAVNPKIVYGQITGYGSDHDRVGYDAVIQAESGFMNLNGEADGPPTKMPVALIDILAAHQLKEALLLSLLRRERTGEGNFVEVSLLDAAVSSLANQATNWLMTGKLPTRKGSAHPNIAPYGESFITKDGKLILLAIGSDRQFQLLVKILNCPSVAEQLEFATNEARVKNRGDLNAILAQAIQQREGRSFLDELHRHKIPAGQLQNLSEVFEQSAVQRLVHQRASLAGVRNFVASGFGSVKLSSPPHFGEHTEEILAMLLN